MTTPANETRPATRRARSRRRTWVFRLTSVAMAFAAVGTCELLLRWSGYGEDFALVIPVAGHPATLNTQFNPHIDRVYFGAQEMLGPEARRFDVPKPADVYRIVVLGASTVNGFPYATEIAFPRQVEVLLEAQLPTVDVEVLNAGITAINSFEIADLASRCAVCEPDLVIIHAGHNEFFGPGGPGSSVLALPPSLVELTFAVRRSRLGQAMGAFVPAPTAPRRHPLEELPRLTEVRIDAPEFIAAVENYNRNLSSAVQDLRAVGIPVLLTTVASNLRDQAPIRSQWPAGLTSQELSTADAALATVQQLIRSGHSSEAVLQLESLPTKLRDSAVWQYRYAQALELTGNRDAAHEAYSRARDYDGCRFRAPRKFGEIVRRLVDESADPGVQLLDLETIVHSRATGAAPGHDLFLEHVHYNQAGHRLLGRELAKAVVVDVLRKDWDAGLDLSDEEVDHRLGILPEDAVVGATFALEAIETQPLAGAVDGDRVREWLRGEIRKFYDLLPVTRQAAFADLSLHEMQHTLLPALAQRHAGRGNLSLSLGIAEKCVRRQPWDPAAWSLMAQARAASEDHPGASEACRTALRLNPGDVAAQQLLKGVERRSR